MSRLYASIDADASKTQATRRGHKDIETHTRGWDVGIRVHVYVENGVEVFNIYQTGGSHAATCDRIITRIVDGRVEIPAS